MRRAVPIAAVALVVAAGATGAGIAARGAVDDGEQPITGTALERASAAALASTGGGRVTDTEVGDEDAFYEVEVTLPDGSEVDVHLDRSFEVVSSETDSETPDDPDE